MIGWVQAVAASAFGISVVIAIAMLIGQHLEQCHKRKMKQMEQNHEILNND